MFKSCGLFNLFLVLLFSVWLSFATFPSLWWSTSVFKFIKKLICAIFLMWWGCAWASRWLLVQDNKITDTSAADARRGKDIQGIPWERLSISREKYRQTRLDQYKNYENIPQSGEGSEKVEQIFPLGCYWNALEHSFSHFVCSIECAIEMLWNIALHILLLPFVLSPGMQANKEGGNVLWVLAQYKICDINYPSFSSTWYGYPSSLLGSYPFNSCADG